MERKSGESGTLALFGYRKLSFCKHYTYARLNFTVCCICCICHVKENGVVGQLVGQLTIRIKGCSSAQLYICSSNWHAELSMRRDDDDDASPRWLCNISARLAGIVLSGICSCLLLAFSHFSPELFLLCSTTTTTTAANKTETEMQLIFALVMQQLDLFLLLLTLWYLCLVFLVVSSSPFLDSMKIS